MASTEKDKEAADYKDFKLLVELIRDDKEVEAQRLIDSKDFSREVWNGRSMLKVPAPLKLAVWKGQVNMVRCLLQHGMDYYDDDNMRESSDYHDIGFGDYYFSAIIAYPPIVSAVHFGHLEITRTFVEEFGYDVNVFKHEERGFGTRLYHLLAYVIQRTHINKKLLKYLIDAGAEVNWVGPQGTILHKLAQKDNQGDMCKFFFSQGFNQIDARNEKGRTAFCETLLYFRRSMSDVLVAHGADVNLGDSRFPNSFVCAMQHTRFSGMYYFQYLLKCGADPDVPSGPSGLRVIDIALARNLFSIVHHLAIVLNTPINEQLVQECIQGISDVPSTDDENRTSTKILLLKAGYNIGPESFDSLSNLVTELQNSDATTYIIEVLSQPRSLADMCCFKIRRVLGKSLPKRVDRLPLPKKLADFVKLTHVEAVWYQED